MKQEFLMTSSLVCFSDLRSAVREGVDDHTEDEVEHDDDHDEVEEHVVDDPKIYNM
jgi:hypothetical protein